MPHYVLFKESVLQVAFSPIIKAESVGPFSTISSIVLVSELTIDCYGPPFHCYCCSKALLTLLFTFLSFLSPKRISIKF
jgi:hypothetical protein